MFLQWRLNLPPWQPIGAALDDYVSELDGADYHATLGGAMAYSLIRGDLEPDMELQAKINGVAENLTTAQEIKLRWQKPDGTVALVTVTSVDLTLGKVKRVWVAGDTDQVGLHRGQLRVVRSNGEVQTFPNDQSYYLWNVNRQLGDELT